QYCGRSVPSGEEPDDRAALDRQLPALAAMNAAAVTTEVERLRAFAGDDLEDLCEATVAAIEDGGGFGWVKAPARGVLEAYWKGVLLVPERALFVARLNGTICGAVQLVSP